MNGFRWSVFHRPTPKVGQLVQAAGGKSRADNLHRHSVRGLRILWQGGGRTEDLFRVLRKSSRTPIKNKKSTCPIWGFNFLTYVKPCGLITLSSMGVYIYLVVVTGSVTRSEILKFLLSVQKRGGPRSSFSKPFSGNPLYLSEEHTMMEESMCPSGTDIENLTQFNKYSRIQNKKSSLKLWTSFHFLQGFTKESSSVSVLHNPIVILGTPRSLHGIARGPWSGIN